MHRYSIVTDPTQDLAAATAETLIQLVTGATREAKIAGFSLGLTSVTPSDLPVLVQFALQTTAGTGSAVTPASLRIGGPAAISTAQRSFTAEPTTTTVIRQLKMTPVGGMIVYHFPEGWEITVPVSTRVGMIVNSPSALTDVVGEMLFEE